MTQLWLQSAGLVPLISYYSYCSSFKRSTSFLWLTLSEEYLDSCQNSLMYDMKDVFTLAHRVQLNPNKTR